MKEKTLNKLVNACLELSSKEKHMDTISDILITEFADIAGYENIQFSTARKYFRCALNECYLRGYCNKEIIGTPYQQTGDTYGGKYCYTYTFLEQSHNK